VDYVERQRWLEHSVIPSVMAAGAILSWVAGLRNSPVMIVFLCFFLYQTTLAAIWIGFRRIPFGTQVIVSLLLVIEGIFAARGRHIDGSFVFVTQAPSLVLMLCCRVWWRRCELDPGYMAMVEADGRSSQEVARDMQFSVKQLMILTLVVACLIAFGRWVATSWVLSDGAEWWLIYTTAMVYQSLTAIRTMLGVHENVLWRTSIASTVVVFVLCILRRLAGPQALYVSLFILFQYVALIASLAVCRWTGTRLVALPDGLRSRSAQP